MDPTVGKKRAIMMERKTIVARETVETIVMVMMEVIEPESNEKSRRWPPPGPGPPVIVIIGRIVIVGIVRIGVVIRIIRRIIAWRINHRRVIEPISPGNG